MKPKIGGYEFRSDIEISTTPPWFSDLNKSRQRKRPTGVTLPWFHVHQIAGNFLMDGGAPMGKRESVPNRQYTDEFKVEAIRLSESIGGSRAATAIGHSGFEPVELDQAEPCREAHGRGRCRRCR